MTKLLDELQRNAAEGEVTTFVQLWKEVEAEAEEDPEFLASLTEGRSSQADVRQRLARRLGVDEASLEPFKETIMAKMLDLWTAPDATPEAFDVYEAGKWHVETSRKVAWEVTGVVRPYYLFLRDFGGDSCVQRGKGGALYEFVDMSVPDDIDDFVEVRVRSELLQVQPHGPVRKAYFGRSFVDTDTDQRFTVCDVFNNYDIATDDHSLRLCLWFYDAKKYKKTPAKSQWDWCQVARMAADGYKFVDSSAPPAPKKRKTK